MIAVDANLLVYAHRSDMLFHARARQVLIPNFLPVALDLAR